MLTRSTEPADRLRIYAQAVIDSSSSVSLTKDNFSSLSLANDAFKKMHQHHAQPCPTVSST